MRPSSAERSSISVPKIEYINKKPRFFALFLLPVIDRDDDGAAPSHIGSLSTVTTIPSARTARISANVLTK
jgi:hypothetical protein